MERAGRYCNRRGLVKAREVRERQPTRRDTSFSDKYARGPARSFSNVSLGDVGATEVPREHRPRTLELRVFLDVHEHDRNRLRLDSFDDPLLALRRIVEGQVDPAIASERA